MQRQLARALLVAAMMCQIAMGADRVPFLISRSSPETTALWNEVNGLVVENEAMEHPLPDPYIARGDIWRSVGCHEDALIDYLKAIELATSNSPSPAEKSRLLSQLHRALANLVEVPVQSYPQESRESFRAGATLFTQRRYSEAHLYFADAVRMSPRDPIYRAFLAVTLKSIGDQVSADKQAVVTANLVRRRSSYDHKRVLSEFHDRLALIQGRDRTWLHSVMSSREFTSKSTADSIAVALNQVAESMK